MIQGALASKLRTASASKLKALIFFRAGFVSLLFGAGVILDVGLGLIPYPHWLSAFIVGLYGLTIVYSLLYQRLGENVRFAYLQFCGDILSEAVLVYMSGGIGSWFTFTFPLTILSASIILHGRGGYLVASFATVVYGGILGLQANGLILTAAPSGFPPIYFVYNIFIHIIAFYSMAYLSTYLAARLRRVTEHLERTHVDLSDLKAFSRDVIENIPVGLITTDISGTILTANPAARGILGDGIDGLQIVRLLPFIDISDAEGGRIEGEFRRGSATRVIGLGISPLKNRTGEAIGRIIIFRDLTDIRALEIEMRRKRELAALGEMSASIAHELRNPLASLKGSIEMIREESASSAGSEGRYTAQLMDIAVKEMDRLNRIITDFLSYARPAEPRMARLDLSALLCETVFMIGHRKEIRVDEMIDDRLEIDGDEDQLKQVFLNLVVNAVDAMPDGGVLSVRARADDKGVVARVADTGTGIAMENIGRIFFPFFSTKKHGTGLGLAIAYRIVEAHGGAITAESPPEGGAVFTVRLPKRAPGRKQA
ncbi:MAG: PAS domain-containing protein [Nitrospirae bacterium]|nr:PAS domain-containing protein [Nitrospirota bacterium]